MTRPYHCCILPK